MKKLICGVIAAVMCTTACSGCTTTITDTSNECKVIYGHFIIVREEENFDTGSCYTVYDHNTGVMYYIIEQGYGLAMSAIYDEYGNICTYDSDAH